MFKEATLQLPQVKRESFDFDEAAALSRRKLEIRNLDDKARDTDEAKMEKSDVKRKLKELASRSSNPEAAKKILELEEGVQAMLLEKEKLEEGLSGKKEISWPFTGRRAVYDDRPGKSYNIGGFDVSEAEILNDLNWGIFYELGDDVPVDFRLKYLEAAYQSKIDNLADRQLVIERVEIIDKLDDKMQGTYERVQAALEKGGEERAGLIFEKMVYNLLSDIASDVPELGLKVKKLDVIDDVENKIDFIVKIKKKNRAVGVAEVDEDESVGIQCTLADKNSEKFKLKERQVARSKRKLEEIDDLLLVSIPVGNKMVMDVYNNWKMKGRPAGGPEKMFSADKKQWFVEQILQGTELVKDETFKKTLEKHFKGE